MTIEICGIITTGADPETPGKGGGGGGGGHRIGGHRIGKLHIISLVGKNTFDCPW